MAVAFLNTSESHTGTTGSASQASFTWNHGNAGDTPKGVLIFTFVNLNADDALSVTFGGVNVPAVSGGRAVDTATEPGDCKAWFLGSGLPTGVQAVVVNRTNNANVMYAAANSVSAAADTEVYLAGIVLLQEDRALTQQSVDDGSPGTNSVRFAGCNYGGMNFPAAGTNSTTQQFIDFGARTIGVVSETVAGQGSRLVGFTDASDDVAAVHLAVREVSAAAFLAPRGLFLFQAVQRAATW